MAKKRESRQKPRQSDAIRGENKRVKGDCDTDCETLRRVREWAEVGKINPDLAGRTAAREVLAILNGTERKETKR